MKRLTLVLAMAAVGFAHADVVLKTQAQKVGYAIGTDIGSTFADMNTDGKESIDFNALVVGLRDAYEKRKLAMTDEEMESVMKTFAEERQKEMRAQAEQMIENSKADSEKFLKENAKKDGVKTTDSGLQYKVNKEGTGKQPGPDDTVSVQYEGRLIDGTVFDSSKQHGGQPVEFNIQQVIPGWVEGIQLMKEGGEYTFYIPAELAYGEFGQPGAGILPGAALVFDVTLEKVIPAEQDGSVPALNDAKEDKANAAVEKAEKLADKAEAETKAAADKVADKTEAAAEEAKKTADEAAKSIENTAEQASDKIKAAADSVAEKAENAADTVKAETEKAADKVKEAVEQK